MTALLGILLACAGAGAFTDAFDQACAEYEQKDYIAAAQRFEQLVDEDVVAPAVFYNLGNCYYRLGRLGPAIANYERALHLAPGFENAAQNMAECIKKTERRLNRVQRPEWERSLLFWHYTLPPKVTRAVAVFLWYALWTALALRLWRPERYLSRMAIVLAVLAAAFGASAWAKAHPPALAVAAVERVPVHYGTNEDEAVRFELYEGDRVAVDRRADGWARVNISSGERGWARESDLVFVGPPYEASRAPL